MVAAFPGGPRPQGAAALGAGGSAGRRCHKARQRWAPVYVRGLLGPGERKSVQPADGGAGRAGGLRPAAPLHQQPGLADRPARGGAGAGGGPAGRWAGRGADHRRHRAAQEGRALGRCCSAIRRRAGEDGELPGPGLAHPGPRRGAGARGAAALSAQDLVPGSETLRQGGCAGGLPRLPQQGGDRTRRARPAPGGRGALRLRPGRRRLRQQCRLPARPRRPRPALGGRHPADAGGLFRREGVYSAARGSIPPR